MPYEDLIGNVIFNEISEEELHSQESLEPNQYWLTPDDTEKLKEFNLPLGMILPSAIVQEHPALQRLDGSTFSQSGIYNQFVTFLKRQASEGRVILYTQSQYDADINTYGQCGHFVIDDTNNTFRLPTITEFIASSNGGKTIGLAELDSFKNHTHGTKVRSGSSAGSYNGYPPMSANSGTTTAVSDGVVYESISGGEETKPKNIRYPYYIVLANNLEVDASSLDIGSIVNDISLISQKTFSNYPMPSDTYETLTPTTSGTVFIAPTNGWFCATGTSTSTSHCQVSLTNANGFTSRSQISGYKDTGCRCFLPAKRGDSITFTNQNMTSMVVRFYYAEGEI